MFEFDTHVEILGMDHPAVIGYTDDPGDPISIVSVFVGKELPETQYSSSGEYLGYYRTSVDVFPILDRNQLEELTDRIEVHRRKLAEEAAY